VKTKDDSKRETLYRLNNRWLERFAVGRRTGGMMLNLFASNEYQAGVESRKRYNHYYLASAFIRLPSVDADE
jgi:hypothetical protein